MDMPVEQINRFKLVARELECDDSHAMFRRHLGKLATHKSVEKPNAS